MHVTSLLPPTAPAACFSIGLMLDVQMVCCSVAAARAVAGARLRDVRLDFAPLLLRLASGLTRLPWVNSQGWTGPALWGRARGRRVGAPSRRACHNHSQDARVPHAGCGRWVAAACRAMHACCPHVVLPGVDEARKPA